MSDREYKYLTRESLDAGTIAVIMLNRPDTRNAQNRGLLVELGQAFAAAEEDDTVRVIILGGHGPMFSAGHDMGSRQGREDMAPGPNQHPSARVNGGTRDGAERLMLQEWHHFFESTRRWRNLRKITIAAVHGQVYSAGLMLMWACDLILAAEGTTFADVVGTRLGMCGIEYFAHPWEFGPRKAKELLLTGDSMAALLIKESVNQSVDQMGFYNALNACFSLHELNHAHWAWIHDNRLPMGTPQDEGISDGRTSPRTRVG
jgi:enoyl-CoA hydratase